jgi:geranylgeranyl diphosphate synthase, type II
MSLVDYISERSKLIEKHLDALVCEKSVPYNPLFSAARYSLMGGGKRLRPILTLATVEALGGELSRALTPACALELIHTYSLIHDDLPCMDNDDFRRGKPSLHKMYPEGHAVLTGDFLLTYAFEVIAEDPQLQPTQKIQLISILAKSSGGEGMIAGQVMDLEAEGKRLEVEQLSLIHRKKTGMLITAALEFGAVIADAPAAHLNILSEFGQEIGLAFQIVDDVLDVTASQAKHGKETASDLTNHKSTYVSLMGLRESQTLAQSLIKSAVQKLDQLPHDTSLLQELAELIANRKF